jgi:metallo-beta-lactamase family protein
MQVSFHGATQEVTGSCHLVRAAGLKILLDCGMYQGGKERHEKNRKPFPFDPEEIDYVILSHAHIDHSGRLPLLVRAGYRGPIISSSATRALCTILLPDAGRIQEEDARWKIKRLRKKDQDYSWVTPLFTEEDTIQTLKRFESVPFEQSLPLNSHVEASFIQAGHILGASIVKLVMQENGKTRTLVFSGDLGVSGARLMAAPKTVACPDYLIMESTYGDRVRDPCCDATEELYRVISKTIRRRGKVIIPSFAVGRTQEVLARINDLVEKKRLRDVAVFVDSPMAVAATKAFVMHPEAYSEEARKSLKAGDAPLEFPGLKLIKDVEDSIALNKSNEPAVIISASGMCDAGRIKHHLKHNISSSRNTILFVGYQAHGSLGRVIQSGANPVRIFGEYYPVAAQVSAIDTFSAHADRNGLIRWFAALQGKPKKTFVVHGETDAALSLVGTLKDQFHAKSVAPKLDSQFELH